MPHSEYTASPRLRHVSYSELSTFRQCPHKHDLAYLQRWDKAEAPAPLTRGRLFHEMLAEHYTALQQRRFSEVPALLETVTDEDLRDLLAWMYEGYTENYGLDEGWKVLKVEEVSEAYLPTVEGAALQRLGHYNGSVGRSVYRLKMVLDLLVQDEEDRIWLVDHKTNADFPNEIGLDLDDQFSLYQWGLLQQGIEVYGVVYNCVRTRRNKSAMPLDTRFKRIPMYRTPAQLANTALDAYRTTRRMRSAEFKERTTNSDTCQWRCQYTEPCLWGRKGGEEAEFLTSAGFSPDSEHR